MKRTVIFARIATAAALIVAAGCGPKSVTGPTQANPRETVSEVRFTDATAISGIVFKHNSGAFGAKLMPETMGSGAAFIDYDNDDDQDIFFVNSRQWTPAEAEEFKNGTGKKYRHLVPPQLPTGITPCVFYRNDGTGKFTDVTAETGLGATIYGMGATTGDYDNDGFTDLYVTGLGRNYLFRNTGNGRFEEVAKQAGVAASGWSTSAAFLDYDKDGRLDLFVCRYVKWSPGTDIECKLEDQKSYCTPQDYEGVESLLYHNEGSAFKDVSQESGIRGHKTPEGTMRAHQGKSLGVAITDFNEDGWLDIVVANDMEPNYLFRNEGGSGKFSEVGTTSNIAFNEAGMARAAMGVDCGDIDHSGRESLVFGNFSNQMLGLYQNHGRGLFIDIAPGSEVGEASLQFLAFGAFFADIDNDGWLDIFTANGHVENDINRVQRYVTYEQRPLLFLNRTACKFKEVGESSGDILKKKVVARGAAYADVDLDGDRDLLITVNNGPAILARNESGNKNGSIRITLQGTKSNRSGYGAQIVLKAGKDTQRTMVRGGSSYLSQSETSAVFGLGQAAKADSIIIRWPSGKTTELKDIPARRRIVVNEDRGIVKDQPLG